MDRTKIGNEISDDELDIVSGGSGASYEESEMAVREGRVSCPGCGLADEVTAYKLTGRGGSPVVPLFLTFKCKRCGRAFMKDKSEIW